MISLSKSRVVFIVSYVAYGTSYFLRKPVGVLKPAMEKELGFTPSMLGCLDVALLLPYAFVQMFAGHWVAVYGARRTFAACMWLSAAAVVPLGISSSSFAAVFLHIFLEGACQALLWPCCVRLLDQWTAEEGRNTIMGVFNSCAFVGGIVANLLAVSILSATGWRLVFPICSLFVAAMGICVYLTCHDNPAKTAAVEIESPTDKSDDSSPSTTAETSKPSSPTSSPPLSWRELWFKPGFADICVCMLCLKVTRYFVYMWLPYLYTKEFGYSEVFAGTAASGFEFGGVFGSMLIGFLIDSRLNGDVLRGVVYSVILALGSFFCFTFSSIVFFLPLWIPHIFFISINGAANAGSDAMLGSAVPARLGAAYGGSTAAITGLVNGFGTVGSFLQGPMSGFIGGHWGWMMNLYLMLGLNLLAAFTAVRAYKARRGS